MTTKKTKAPARAKPSSRAASKSNGTETAKPPAVEFQGSRLFDKWLADANASRFSRPAVVKIVDHDAAGQFHTQGRGDFRRHIIRWTEDIIVIVVEGIVDITGGNRDGVVDREIQHGQGS